MAKKFSVMKNNKKIYINRNPVIGPWGGGNNFVKGLYEHMPELGFKIIDNPFLETPDIIFLQSPKPDSICNFSINEAIRIKQSFPHVKIIIRVNDCDDRKNTTGIDDFWIECSKYVDKTVFVSRWMKEYFLKKGWHCNENFVLYNGVNRKHFKEREKISNGKINIVTHHWSNNRMKGFDIYEKLDAFTTNNDKFTFTYIGRDLGTFKNTKVISPKFGKDLGEELSRYNVYVSDSKSDPGPNHILESLACNIPTYVSKDGGGCIEFAGKEFIFNDFEDLKLILTKERYNKNSTIKLCNWKGCIEKLSIIINSQ